MAAVERMSIGVVIERRRVEHPWQPERWRAVAALPGRPAAAPGTLLARGEGWARYYAGAVELALFPGETEGYRDNLASSRPAIYVVLRRCDGEPGLALRAATVDPGEIEAQAEAGDDLIEALPLPPAVAAWIAGFVARHHVERPFHKRRRDRADPEALAPRRPPSSTRESSDG